MAEEGNERESAPLEDAQTEKKEENSQENTQTEERVEEAIEQGKAPEETGEEDAPQEMEEEQNAAESEDKEETQSEEVAEEQQPQEHEEEAQEDQSEENESEHIEETEEEKSEEQQEQVATEDQDQNSTPQEPSEEVQEENLVEESKEEEQHEEEQAPQEQSEEKEEASGDKEEQPEAAQEVDEQKHEEVKEEKAAAKKESKEQKKEHHKHKAAHHATHHTHKKENHDNHKNAHHESHKKHHAKQTHEHAHKSGHHKKEQHHEHHKKPFSITKWAYDFYDKQYKMLLIIPFVLLILAFGQIGFQIVSTSYYDAQGNFHFGDFVDKAVSLKGGTSIVLDAQEVDISNLNVHQLESVLKSEFPKHDIIVREQSNLGELTGVLIEATVEFPQDVTAFKASLLKNIPSLTKEIVENNIASIGSTLGSAFFAQTFRALIIAFILMGIIVFLYFRVVVPSVAVILAAFSDIVVTLAIINVLGFKLTTAGIAAFLMLIGYSVDTDILLSSRILKRKEGTVLERTLNAMSTGLTMNATTLAAISIAYIFSTSPDLKQIMAILIIGLLVDIINTWIQNAGLLRWYMEKEHGKV